MGEPPDEGFIDVVVACISAAPINASLQNYPQTSGQRGRGGGVNVASWGFLALDQKKLE